MLWILFRHSGDTWWRERAEHYSRLIEHRKTDRNVHDLGFLFLPTWKAWYDLTGDPAKNQVVIEADRTLALRFQHRGRYLRSFVAPDSVFIDIMMNVGIIFYAAQQTKDASLLQVATDHCLTTRREAPALAGHNRIDNFRLTPSGSVDGRVDLRWEMIRLSISL